MTSPVLPEIDRQQENRDLLEIQKLNDEIREMEEKKHQIVLRIVARYQSGVAPADMDKHKSPVFDDVLQRYAYEILSQVGSSITKPMGDYAVGKGYDFKGSSKPGNKIVQSLKRRPDVFTYDRRTEKWSLKENG